MIERIKRLPPVAAVYRMLHPTNSTCGCCGLPWAVVKEYTIEMGLGRGFFPVCEWCWNHKSQDEIDKAIVDLYNWWVMDCEAIDIEVPYKLTDMIANAHKQRFEQENKK